MFDITKIGPIINHLKNISSYYKDPTKEIIIFCPYCDDATRSKATHGHLYISKTHPVFNCFRCSSSGTLIRLLVDTGFDDEEILKFLAQFVKYKSIKDYYYTVKKKTPKLKIIQDEIIQRNINFETKYPDKFKMYEQYLYSRLGNVDYNRFLISPTFFNNKLSCMFTNSNDEDVALRLIEPYKDYRYHLNEGTSEKYYFQERNFENITRITLGEGPFDVLNLYLYSLEFKDAYHIALNGKKYSSMIESLILGDFLIGDIIIDMVFDTDVLNYKTYLFRARILAKQYNQNVVIKGWAPAVGKDTGDYPALIEV